MARIHPKHPDDITPQWLTYALRQAGVLTNSTVKSIKKDTMAEGKAWLSTIVRVEAEYDSVEENVPTSFVLKLLSESRLSREARYELSAYEREINFYNKLAGKIPIRLPKLIYSENGYHSNLMLMEDLSYLTPGDQVIGMNQQQVLTTLESLAKVHGTYWNNPILDNLEWIPNTNNIEVDYGESGSDEAVIILDWQFVIRSIGATDVARLIGGSELLSERSGRQFEALRFWYDKLLVEGVTNYSWEEAQRDFRLGALSCLTFPVHFHKGIVRAEGRALEYVKAMYSRLFLLVGEIEADSVLP